MGPLEISAFSFQGYVGIKLIANMIFLPEGVRAFVHYLLKTDILKRVLVLMHLMPFRSPQLTVQCLITIFSKFKQ